VAALNRYLYKNFPCAGFSVTYFKNLDREELET